MTPAGDHAITEARARCAQRNAEHEPVTWFMLTDGEIQDLASGYVPTAVRARCLFALETDDRDQRMAERPVKVSRKKAG